MVIHNPILTGSFTVNNIDVSSITSSAANITALNATTASLNSFSASVLTFTGSANTRLGALEAATASLYTATSSFSGRVGALESYTASQTLRNATYATTGSNTLTGTQYISNTNNAVGFSNTTSSIYTDGGLQVTKDAYISSSLYIKGNLTVYGTQSVSYISSSTLNVGTNLITVNTATPSVRFGGIAVQDSGSTSGLTGSLLWDSQNNNWLYDNPSGSGNYDSAMLIMGPRNSSALGSEVGLNCNYLVLGHGSHHTTSSQIYHDGSTTCIGTGMSITSAGTACFASSVTANNSFTNQIGLVINGNTTGGIRQNFIAQGSSGTYNFQIGTTITTNNAFEIIPSTAADGTTFSTAIFKILNTGAATFSSNINAGGGSDIGNATSRIVISNNTLTNTRGLGFYANDGTQNPRAWINHITANGSQRLEFNSDWSSATSYANFAFMNGNVGMGTTSPIFNLSINSSGDCKLQLLNNLYQVGKLTLENNDLNIHSTFSGNLIFKTANNTTSQGDGTTRLTITGAGVSCFAGVVCAQQFIGVSSMTVNGPIYFQNGGNTYFQQYVGASCDFVVYNTTNNGYSIYTNSAQRFFIAGNGNIGINCSSPNATLHINGCIKQSSANFAIAQFTQTFTAGTPT